MLVDPGSMVSTASPPVASSRAKAVSAVVKVVSKVSAPAKAIAVPAVVVASRVKAAGTAVSQPASAVVSTPSATKAAASVQVAPAVATAQSAGGGQRVSPKPSVSPRRQPVHRSAAGSPTSDDDGNKKIRWNEEPYIQQIRDAVKVVLSGISASKVAKARNIPGRTLRRYVMNERKRLNKPRVLKKTLKENQKSAARDAIAERIMGRHHATTSIAGTHDAATPLEENSGTIVSSTAQDSVAIAHAKHKVQVQASHPVLEASTSAAPTPAAHTGATTSVSGDPNTDAVERRATGTDAGVGVGAHSQASPPPPPQSSLLATSSIDVDDMAESKVRWNVEPHLSKIRSAVALALSGKSASKVASEFGIPARTLRRYVMHEREAAGLQPGTSTSNGIMLSGSGWASEPEKRKRADNGDSARTPVLLHDGSTTLAATEDEEDTQEANGAAKRLRREVKGLRPDRYAQLREFQSSFPGINELVRKQMASLNDVAHDYMHCKRVASMAWMIAYDEVRREVEAKKQGGESAEPSSPTIDTKVAYLAGLLHNVVGDPGTTMEELSQLLLKDASLTKEQFQKVTAVAEAVGFGKVEKTSKVSPDTLPAEFRCAQDADLLDAMGAVGVNRCLASDAEGNFGEAHPSGICGDIIGGPIMPHDSDEGDGCTHCSHSKSSSNGNSGSSKTTSSSGVAQSFKKFLQLTSMMQTELGKSMARRRRDFMVQYLRHCAQDLLEGGDSAEAVRIEKVLEKCSLDPCSQSTRP